MTNHVHLIVTPKAETENISKLMRLLAARHTRYVNKLESREKGVGLIFRLKQINLAP